MTLPVEAGQVVKNSQSSVQNLSPKDTQNHLTCDTKDEVAVLGETCKYPDR